jgi:phosphatidylethanolamine/phosphatidyl-N-methylethanolamine N-methyltransferase
MPPLDESLARSANPLVEIASRLRLIERLRFLSEFARHPRSTGAIGPSSPELGEAITRDMGLEDADLVVELGAGTGAFTTTIAQRLSEDARFIALELNPRLAASLHARFAPGDVEVVCETAEHLCRHLGRRGVGRVDAIISGLPWVCFEARQQRAILQQIHRALRPYAHAAWLPSGLKLRRELKSVFRTCEVLPIVWRNLPPAFIYRCER